MDKKSSSQVAWATMTSAVTQARIDAHRLRHLITRAQKILEGVEDKESLHQKGGDLIHAVPDVLGKLETGLDGASYALSQMGVEFFKNRLSQGERAEIDEAVRGAEWRDPAKIISRVASRYLEE